MLVKTTRKDTYKIFLSILTILTSLNKYIVQNNLWCEHKLAVHSSKNTRHEISLFSQTQGAAYINNWNRLNPQEILIRAFWSLRKALKHLECYWQCTPFHFSVLRCIERLKNLYMNLTQFCFLPIFVLTLNFYVPRLY